MSDSRVAPPNPAIAVFCRRRPPRGEKVTRGVELWTEDCPATVGARNGTGGVLFVCTCRTRQGKEDNVSGLGCTNNTHPLH